MRGRPTTMFLPGLEPLEAKRLLSGGAPPAPLLHPGAGPRATSAGPADPTSPLRPAGGVAGGPDVPTRQDDTVSTEHGPPPGGAGRSITATAVKPEFGYLVYRLTNPNRFNNHLKPPFQHVLVQDAQPVPGRVYNVLYVAVRNGTARTFDASSGFTVEFPGQHHPFPILRGGEQWKPGQEFVFFVLTKKYYPLANQVSSGFRFVLSGAPSIAIPGPSGIFLRLRYDPATFDRTLDAIVAFGAGAQGGVGVKFGLPDTAINEFVSAKTRRNDFGGYF